MPNRIIREGINDSGRIDVLVQDAGWLGECFYRRLLLVVDDYGIYDARPSILRAKCFPTLLELVREADIQRLVESLDKSGLVRLYTVDGRNYLEVLGFGQFKRAMKARFPRPPDDEIHVQCNGNAHELHVQSETENRIQKTEIENRNECTPEMVRFWKAFPPTGRTRSSRKECWKVWKKLGLDERVDEILAALELWKASPGWQKKNGEFVLGAHRWLEREMFNDPPTGEENIDPRVAALDEK